MANRFVRSTKFRHVFGTPAKKDKCYDNIKITKIPWESNMCDVNGKFLAVVLETQGGGAFTICPLEKTGRYDINSHKVSGHGANVMDLAWNPFNENQIASSSEDCMVMIWDIPDGGLTANIENPIIKLEGHQRKVGVLAWHPTAENILASGGADGTVIIWNIEYEEPVLTCTIGDSSEIIYSLCWNDDGSLLAATTKEKKLKVIDPRKEEVVKELSCHSGSKPSKAVFCGKYIFTTGFSRSNERQYALWDVKKSDNKPLTIETIDTSSGVQNIFYDEGTRMVYLVGKGDSTIRFYEITDEAPYVFFLNMYTSKDPQRGCGCLPKRFMHFMECEVMRFYKLHKNMVEPIAMTVPRKSSMFQDDIYPPCFAGVPALSADEWLGGANKNRVMQKITKEGLGATHGGGVTSPVKLTASAPSSGQLSKQSSYSSNASEPVSLKLERENSPASLSASGDFDESQYKKEIQSLTSQLERLKNENENLKSDLQKKESVISEIRKLIK